MYVTWQQNIGKFMTAEKEGVFLGTKRDCFFMATTKDRYPWRLETQINIKGLNQKQQSYRTEFLKCAWSQFRSQFLVSYLVLSILG